MHDNTHRSQKKSSATPVAREVCAHHDGVAQSEVPQSVQPGYTQESRLWKKKKK